MVDLSGKACNGTVAAPGHGGMSGAPAGTWWSVFSWSAVTTRCNVYGVGGGGRTGSG